MIEERLKSEVEIKILRQEKGRKKIYLGEDYQFVNIQNKEDELKKLAESVNKLKFSKPKHSQ